MSDLKRESGTTASLDEIGRSRCRGASKHYGPRLSESVAYVFILRDTEGAAMSELVLALEASIRGLDVCDAFRGDPLRCSQCSYSYTSHLIKQSAAELRAAAARVGERPAHSQDWIDDCNEWRGRLLTGRYGHWCADYDELPVDESCPEWPCPCNVGDEYKALRALDPDSQACSYPGCSGGHNAPLAVDEPRLAEQAPVYGAASPGSAPRPPREED
jgi:hypothetical protein